MNITRENASATEDAAFAFAMTQSSFGHAEIAIHMNLSEDWARKMVRGWNKAGKLDVLKSGHRVRTIYKVRDDARVRPAPARRSPEQCMWIGMRLLKSFTPRDLAAQASTEATEVTLEAAQAYCRALMAAGFLSVARKAVPGKSEAIYRLARNTGPRPPREKRVRAVVDDNTEQVIVIGGGQ